MRPSNFSHRFLPTQTAKSLRFPAFVAMLLGAVSTILTTLPPVNAAEPRSMTATDSWLGFRGDGTSGSVSNAPEKLDLGDDGNLAWRLQMPGRSVAGPIIVGDLVVTTSSSGQDGEVLHVSGVDLSSGETRWEQTFRASGRPYCHPTSANAAPSPVSDGERVYAFFSSNDLICLSLEGNLLWYRGLGYDYPKAGNDVGMASSPIVAEGAVIVQVEAQGDSFAAAIDAQTGKNLWRMDRPRQSNWSSPLAIRRPDDSVEVILQSRQDAIAVDPRSGKIKWRTTEAGSAIASATATNDVLLLPGGDLIAMGIGATASEPEILWGDNKVSPKNASAAINGDRVYSLKGSVLVAASLSDGRKLWQARLGELSGTWATPAVAADKIYIFDQSGTGMVIRDLGEESEIISKVDLGEGVLGSPAIASGRLIVRSYGTLFCFDSRSLSNN